MPAINSITQKAEHFIRWKRRTKRVNEAFKSVVRFDFVRFYPQSIFSLSFSILLATKYVQLFTQWTEYFAFIFVLPYKAFAHTQSQTRSSMLFVLIFFSAFAYVSLIFIFNRNVCLMMNWRAQVFFQCYSHSDSSAGGGNESSIKRSKRNSNKKINFVCLVCVCDESIFNVRFPLFHCDFTWKIQKGFLFYALFRPLLSLSSTLSLRLFRHVHCSKMIETIVKKTANFRKHADNDGRANGNSYENVFMTKSC